MISYADGTEAQAGDTVLLHHRTYTGTVRYVIGSPLEVLGSGAGAPGLMIDTSYGGLVFHAQEDLTAEEVELVSRSLA